MKIVVNRCWGGFSISLEAAIYMEKRGHKVAKEEISNYRKRCDLVDFKIKTGHWPAGSNPDETKWLESDVKLKLQYPDETDTFPTWYGYGNSDISKNGYARNDPILVEAVEKLAEKANGRNAKLEIVDIPDGISDWYIDEYDGMEKVCERHREW